MAATSPIISHITKGVGELASIRQSQKTVHYVGIVRVEDRKDICSTILVSIKGFHIKDALVDSGARVSLISELVVNKVGMPISRSSSARVAVADGGVVHCIGIVEDAIIKCFGVSISMDFHVIALKGPSYSLVLGRPWMQELNVVQDWSKGLITMTPSKGVDIHHDMRQQRLVEKEEDGITE